MNQEFSPEKPPAEASPLPAGEPRRHPRRRRPKRHSPALPQPERRPEPEDGRQAMAVEKSNGDLKNPNPPRQVFPSRGANRQQAADSHSDYVALSVVIPLFNESPSLLELHGKLSEVINRMRVRAEIIFVDDGSTDDSFTKLRQLQQRDRRVRVIQFRRNYGKSAALAAGFARAQGRQIVTMDADLQDDPAEIPQLLRELNRGCDLISGWKKRRHDKFSKRLASKIFNTVTSLMTGVRLHDINCGLKAYRREVTDSIHVYGQLHRYLPVLAQKEGFRIGETEVRHHPRKYGKSKFGPSRYTGGFFDLLTVLFLTRYTRRPLHLFGIAGLTSFLLGFGIDAYLTYERLVNKVYLTNRPILWLGLLLIIVGIQMICFGLLGEMIAATQNQAPNYGIKAELGFERKG
jgi:glycosyltransferase involved in cell wall biosynthesis